MMSSYSNRLFWLKLYNGILYIYISPIILLNEILFRIPNTQFSLHLIDAILGASLIRASSPKWAL